jgi:hypothetical protein
MSLNLIETASAQTLNGTAISTDALIEKILANIVDPLITLMLALAIIYFLWGVFDFVRNAESPEDRKTGGQHILWGVIGIFVMVTAYGILNLIVKTIRQ